MTHVLKTNPQKLILKTLMLVGLFLFTLMLLHKPAQAASCATPSTDYGTDTMTVNVPSSGSYVLWTRILVPDTTNTSINAEVNGTTCFNVGGGSGITANTWTWVNYQNGVTGTPNSVSLTAGNNTVKLIGTVPGVEVDRIIVTTDTTCVPTGTGDNCATLPSAPTVNLSASPTTINSGSSSTLTWSSTNATSSSATTPSSWTSSTASSGSQSVSPTSTTAYTITCTGAGGSTPANASVTVTQTGVFTIGETNSLSTTDSGNANLIAAQSATLSQTATIQSLSFYVGTAAGKLRLGIYDSTGPSGGPGALKAQTAEITPTTGWNAANVTSQVSLSPGTYWLTYLPNNNSLTFVKTQDSTSSGLSCSFTYAALPNSFCSPTTSTPSHWSFYATFNAGSGGTTIVGDLNGDGHVNIFDLSILLSHWQQSGSSITGDLNNDGTINIFDLSILLGHYGT